MTKENDPVATAPGSVTSVAEHLPRIDALAPFRTALLEFRLVIYNEPLVIMD